MDEDIKIMLEFKNGDKSAFDKIMDKYEKPIINFAYRFTWDKNSSEDLAQEVFLRVYKAAKNYLPNAKFSTWLYKIATNVCIDYKRKIRRDTSMHRDFGAGKTTKGEDSKILMDVEDKSASADKSLEERETEETVKKALASLPESQRIAVILRIYEEKSYEEISRIMEVTVPSVESLLFRARQELKKILVKTDKNL